MSRIRDTKPLVVGITGKYCSGKNAVCSILEQYRFEIIDVDTVGHEVLESLRDVVVDRFGPAIQKQDGSIDRRALGNIVFADSVKLTLLESILHPEMVESVRKRIAAGESERYAVNAAILQKMGLHTVCSWAIWVTAPVMVRVRRARIRDNLSFCAAWGRIRSQHKLSLQTLPLDVDRYTVRNRGNLPALERPVEALLSSKGIR